MYIKQLAIHNFRNFAHVATIDFPKQALLIAAAPNATGKTNFLEAISFLLRGKSFRASADECVQWGQTGFLIRGEVGRGQDSATIAVRYHAPSRKLRIEEQGTPISPITFFARYPLVVFLPEDTFLFVRGPAQRRNFLNQILVSTPAYLSALVQYYRSLKQRNAQLKSAHTASDLEAWTQLLLEHSQVLWRNRTAFAEFINTHVNELYESISGEPRSFKARLVAGDTTAEGYRRELEQAFNSERRYGYTLYGPHRDDLELTTGGKAVRAALSRGQMRSLVIALKLTAHRFIKHFIHEEPLLMLDEVLSELDEQRQTALLKNLPATQILLTCTLVPATLRQRPGVHLLDLRSILAESSAPASVSAPTPPHPAKEPTPKTVTEPAPIALPVSG